MDEKNFDVTFRSQTHIFLRLREPNALRGTVCDTQTRVSLSQLATFVDITVAFCIASQTLLTLRHAIHVGLDDFDVSGHVVQYPRLVRPQSKVCLSECRFELLTINDHRHARPSAKWIEKTAFPVLECTSVRVMNVGHLTGNNGCANDVVLLTPVYDGPIECAKGNGTGLRHEWNEYRTRNVRCVLSLKNLQKCSLTATKCRFVIHMKHDPGHIFLVTHNPFDTHNSTH